MSSKWIGDPCPKCGTPLVRRERMFFYKHRYEDGAVCVGCNALWPIDGEEIGPFKPSESPFSRN